MLRPVSSYFLIRDVTASLTYVKRTVKSSPLAVNLANFGPGTLTAERGGRWQFVTGVTCSCVLYCTLLQRNRLRLCAQLFALNRPAPYDSN